MAEVVAPHGVFQGKVFEFPVRVYYEDTDAGGVVYYANYLKFAERARTEFVRALGVNQQADLESEEKSAFMVRSLTIDYKAPAVLDDVLVVTCEMVEAKGAGCVMKQEIRRGEQILVSLEVKLAHVSLSRRRPTRIPESLLQKIEAL